MKVNWQWPSGPDSDWLPWYTIARRAPGAPFYLLGVGLIYVAVLWTTLSHDEAYNAIEDINL